MNETPSDHCGYAPLFEPCADAALDALSEIYREAGLDEENARKSALADYVQTYGPVTQCAA